MKKCCKAKKIAVISLICVFLFMFIASNFNNANGKVTISDVYYPNSEGGILHAQLFVPDGVSSANPVPAILNMHGGSDYLQTVSNYSIELARRGYVVLSVDAYGSGSSDFVSGGAATQAGGADSASTSSALKLDGGASLGIEQLLEYKFVDSESIGLIGHSMGGTYIANAALDYPDNVRAIMPWGSGSFVDKMKASDPNDYKFNVGYINAKADEMVYFATHADTAELFKSDELKNFVGTDEDIVPGEVYGSFEDKTAKIIYQPNTTHIGNIICRDSIASLCDFFSQAMPTGTTIANDDQVWMYKELFCVLATVALLVFAISLGYVMLGTAQYEPLILKGTATVKNKSWVQIVGIIICILVPIITLHKVGLPLAAKAATEFMPMNWANALAWLAAINSAILLVLFLVWHFVYGKKNGGSLAAYGLSGEDGKLCFKNIGLAFVYSVVLMFFVFVVVNSCYALFKIDFRYWQFGIMPVTVKRLSKITGYLLLFIFAMGVLNMVSVVFASIGAGEGKGSAVKQYLLSWVIGAGGYLIVLIIYYVGLRATHKPPFFMAYPPFDTGHPNSLVFSMKTTCLVPTFTLVSALNTALFRKTRNIYVGWFTAAIFATLILIGSNAFAV